MRADQKVAEAERLVILHAMRCWKFEPVNSAEVGYSRRFQKLLAACEKLDRLAAAGKEKP